MPSLVDRVECQAPQRSEDGCERGRAALEGARRADPEERSHPQAEIECASVHEQPLQHVLMAADVRAAEATGFVEMRAWSLEQFPASAEEPFTAAAPDATAIRVHGIPFHLLINPRLWPAIGFADVRANG